MGSRSRWKSKVMTYIYAPRPVQQFAWRGFRLNRTNGSEITTIWNIELEIPRSRSRWSSKVMIYIYAHWSKDSFGVGFVSIGPPVLELRSVETLPLKISGQGHAGCQGSWHTFIGLDLTIHLQSQSDRRFWSYDPLKFLFRKYGVKVMSEVKGHDL